MNNIQVTFTYNLNGENKQDEKIFSISAPDSNSEVEQVIYNHLNSIYPNQVSSLEIVDTKKL